MLFSEATKYIEAFLEDPILSEKDELAEAVKVWGETTKDYVSKITVETPARLNMNFVRLMHMEIKLTGIIRMADVNDTPVSIAIADNLSEYDVNMAALRSLLDMVIEMHRHIQNEVSLAWKNI